MEVPAIGFGKFLGDLDYPTVGREGEQTGIEQPMEVCPERDAVRRHIVLAHGRRYEMRRVESLGCFLAREDAAMLVEGENRLPNPRLPLRSALLSAWPCATCTEIEFERFPLDRIPIFGALA